MSRDTMSWQAYSAAETRRRESGFDYRLQSSYLIARLHRTMRAAMTTALADFGLSFPEFATLNIVRSSEPVTNAELARLTSVSPQATSRIVASLVEMGALVRLDGPGGTNLLVLTDRGMELHDEVLAVEESVIGELAGGDDDWVTTLDAHLRVLFARHDGESAA